MQQDIIWRVHRKDDLWRGMYSSAVSSGMGEARHPVPQDDAILMQNLQELDCLRETVYGHKLPRENMYFGFSDVRQMLFWVYRRDWHEALTKDGFVISEIRGVVVHGRTQAVFDRESDNLILRTYTWEQICELNAQNGGRHLSTPLGTPPRLQGYAFAPGTCSVTTTPATTAHTG